MVRQYAVQGSDSTRATDTYRPAWLLVPAVFPRQLCEDEETVWPRLDSADPLTSYILGFTFRLGCASDICFVLL